LADAPRSFLPPSRSVEEPYLLTPQLAFRIAVLAFFALAVFAVLFLRLWALQVLAGNKYLAQANDNRVRTLQIEAPRGAVLDRNGHVLVSNVAGTRVELWPADLPKTWSAELRELRALQQVTGVPVRQMLKKMNEHGSDPLTPIVVQIGLHNDQIFYLSEHRAEFPGVQLAESWLRTYPYRSTAAQVLGYVGQINATQYKALNQKGYSPNDSIGQTGVESEYDSYLRGRDGAAQLTVDSLGRPKSNAPPSARCATASRSRARTTSRTPTAARSSRSIRATGRCSRWRRTRPTSRRSSSAGRTRRSWRRCSTRRLRSATTTPASTARSTPRTRQGRPSSR